MFQSHDDRRAHLLLEIDNMRETLEVLQKDLLTGEAETIFGNPAAHYRVTHDEVEMLLEVRGHHYFMARHQGGAFSRARLKTFFAQQEGTSSPFKNTSKNHQSSKGRNATSEMDK